MPFKTVSMIAFLMTVLLAGSALAAPSHDVVHETQRAVALEVSDLLGDAAFRTVLESRLADNGDRVSMNDALGLYRVEGGTNLDAVEKILTRDLGLRTWKGTANHSSGLMELRLVVPEGAEGASVNWNEILVAFEPAGEESDWTTVEAFDRAGNVYELDAWVAPRMPVLVADIDASEDLRSGIAMVNEGLQAAGLQATEEQTVERAMKAQMTQKAISCSGIETAKISNIRLNDDHEPWIKGAAEIYAFVSGIDPTVADPEIRLVDMPYLDHDGTTYYPNQILIFWYNYRYLAANVNLYEHDSGTNYQDLLGAVLTGVSQILGAFAPEYAIIATVANAIIQAMPADWLTDDDDYVDVIYTIDTDDLTSSSGRYYYGASSNVTMKLVPYCLN